MKCHVCNNSTLAKNLNTRLISRHSVSICNQCIGAYDNEKVLTTIKIKRKKRDRLIKNFGSLQASIDYLVSEFFKKK